jgi:predicted transposase/invertase (TIGR01784 family)
MLIIQLVSYSLTAIEKSDKVKLEKILATSLEQEAGTEGEKIMVSLAKHWLEEGIEKGIERGIEKGVEKERNKTAINMFKQKLDINLISKVTGLTVLQVQKLKTQYVKYNLK